MIGQKLSHAVLSVYIFNAQFGSDPLRPAKLLYTPYSQIQVTRSQSGALRGSVIRHSVTRILLCPKSFGHRHIIRIVLRACAYIADNEFNNIALGWLIIHYTVGYYIVK